MENSWLTSIVWDVSVWMIKKKMGGVGELDGVMLHNNVNVHNVTEL